MYFRLKGREFLYLIYKFTNLNHVPQHRHSDFPLLFYIRNVIRQFGKYRQYSCYFFQMEEEKTRNIKYCTTNYIEK